MSLVMSSCQTNTPGTSAIIRSLCTGRNFAAGMMRFYPAIATVMEGAVRHGQSTAQPACFGPPAGCTLARSTTPWIPPSSVSEMKRNLFSPLLLAALTGIGGCATVPAQAGSDDAIRVGPRSGSLIVIGGGQVGPDIMTRFIELAGGAAQARIVVIPTAGEGDNFPQDWPGLAALKRAGLNRLTVLHTRDPKMADQESFVAPLREATGVWIPGGRQWRLADSYLGTRTMTELNNVLKRGGVIAGTSAGASIQASYMVRGAVEGNTVMMAPGHEVGFGFLRNVAVDQHLLARNRQEDML